MPPFERYKTSPGFHLAMAVTCCVNVAIVAVVVYFSLSLHRFIVAAVWVLLGLVFASLARQLFHRSLALRTK